MIIEMNFNFWLSVLSILSAGFPWLFLVRYERQQGDPVDKGWFKLYRNFEIIWMLLYGVGLAFAVLFVDINSVNFAALLGLFLSLIAMPTALLAGLTGIYCKIGEREISRGYYERHKDPRKQFLAWTKIPTLQVIGWIQFFMLVIVLLNSIPAL